MERVLEFNNAQPARQSWTKNQYIAIDVDAAWTKRDGSTYALILA
jgi:hypothetical protein